MNYCYEDKDLYINVENNKLCKFKSTETKKYTEVKDDTALYILYEDISGSIICIKIEDNKHEKETLLITKQHQNKNRLINAHFYNNELLIIFSASYKKLGMINLYTKKGGISVFDTCDDANFITFKKENGTIIVAYAKGNKLGTSMILEDGYSAFCTVDSTNPISFHEHMDELYLLTKENRYMLVNLSTKCKYELPSVFSKKPEISFKDSIIFLTYMYGRRKIIYIIADDTITFLEEYII